MEIGQKHTLVMHAVYFLCVWMCVLPFGSVFIYVIVKLYIQAFNLPLALLIVPLRCL